MVELPKHVHCVTKTNKRGSVTVYTFYTKFRNTAAAWPSIALPDPMTKEFIERLAYCEAMDRDDKGLLLLDGKRLPDHKEKSFWTEAAKAHEAFVRRGRDGVKDFKSLVETFQDDANPFWSSLSASTQRGYNASGKMIIGSWGDDLPADLTTVDAHEAIDTSATRRRLRTNSAPSSRA